MTETAPPIEPGTYRLGADGIWRELNTDTTAALREAREADRRRIEELEAACRGIWDADAAVRQSIIDEAEDMLTLDGLDLRDAWRALRAALAAGEEKT